MFRILEKVGAELWAFNYDLPTLNMSYLKSGKLCNFD